MSDIEQLLPCPFCGKPPISKVYASGFLVWCSGCDVGFNTVDNENADFDPWERWNTRIQGSKEFAIIGGSEWKPDRDLIDLANGKPSTSPAIAALLRLGGKEEDK
jgi:hypothetical protein